jgi:hypothetical protein
VAPPHNVRNVKRSIEYAEDIKDTTTLFLTPHSQSPMGDAEEITIVNRTGPGSMPQEPLALVLKMSVSDSERSALESDAKDELASAADSEPDTTIRHRTSIQHPPTFLFITNISTGGESILSALLRRL